MLEKVFCRGGWVICQNLPVSQILWICGCMTFLHPILLVARFDAIPEKDDTENSQYTRKQVSPAE